ncbi:ATP-binding protein [Fodinicola acaciae]|uniref:ATP-binding protein n=1 Tax=Fodinicola acaciae TaxID=2681555 RepID=UPI0013D1A201|nr:ATP-binding protein [Fodinicola acaciae]
MATVRLEISPTPAHVRTARLVAVAVARRSGLEEPVLDEIRLAVGEACSRAVGLHQQHGNTDPVVLDLQDAPAFTVVVTDSAGTELRPDDLGLAEGAAAPDPVRIARDEANGAELSEEAIAAGVGLALIAGLVDDLQVEANHDGPGTSVRMTWPL